MVVPESFQGQLLIATPSMTDEQFARTVVLIIQDNPEGILGVVLNRPAPRQLQPFWHKIAGGRSFDARHLALGGPLGGPVFALHQQLPLSEFIVSDGVFLATDSQALTKLTRGTQTDYRIFLGMAGWSTDQLQQEIERGIWFVSGVDSEFIFDDSSELWERAVRQFGRRQLEDLIKRPLRGSAEQN